MAQAHARLRVPGVSVLPGWQPHPPRTGPHLLGAWAQKNTSTILDTITRQVLCGGLPRTTGEPYLPSALLPKEGLKVCSEEIELPGPVTRTRVLE